MTEINFGKEQKKALSKRARKVTRDYYPDGPPSWSNIGTETQAEMLRLVIKELKEQACGDVAKILEEMPYDTAIQYIKKGLTAVRELKRRERKKTMLANKGGSWDYSGWFYITD